MADVIPTIVPLKPETLAALEADPRPWLDVRLRAYVVEDWTATQDAASAILRRVIDKGLRLRLILSEADDLIHPNRDPHEPLNYRVRSDSMIIYATAVVIEMRDGRRYLCTGRRPSERGFI